MTTGLSHRGSAIGGVFVRPIVIGDAAQAAPAGDLMLKGHRVELCGCASSAWQVIAEPWTGRCTA